MEFTLLVEGYTEHKALPAFFKRWLDDRLNKRVSIYAARFDGWQQLVKDAPQHARLHLEAPKKQVIAVIGLLDLYGPTFYPADKVNPPERYQWAKADIEKQVAQDRFHQFFAVHETEAWLLSDPEIFPTEIRKHLPDPTKRPPESVNFNEPPAKLLERLYLAHLKRNYHKVTDGQNLFSKLDPNTAYKYCPHLRELLDEMLRLAQAAGLG